MPKPERYTLSNGLRVVAARMGELPQVVLRLVIPAGSAAEPWERPGTAALTGHLLTEGTEMHTAQELNARIDYLGALLHANVGHDYVEAEAVLLHETLAEGIQLLAEVVTRPSFPDAEVERIRHESLDALVAREDEPGNVADDRVSLEVFGPRHPYGRPSFGTAEGITAVTRNELVAFHALHYRPAGAYLVAAGDFEPGALREMLEAAFAGWTGEAPAVAYPEPGGDTPEQAGRLIVVPWEDAAQSEIRIAGRGVDRRSPDWVRAAVANYILGGSTITGRLGANLREEKGWTYGANSAFSAGVARGGWTAHTAVDVEVTSDAVEEMLREMRRMAEEPVDEGELRRARDAMVLSLPRAFETPGQVASRLGTLEAYGLPHDYWERYPAAVQAVTAEDVRRIARERFHPDRVVRVVVGGGAAAGD
ncbi:MAG: insulinase family protein [Gemmatimonadetes bacterium]|nr:insulinase family protein [Gemmatimonadota bacterium]